MPLRMPYQRSFVLLLALIIALAAATTVRGLAVPPAPRVDEVANAPQVTIAPVSVAPGTAVTITGAGFATDLGIIRISFNGQMVAEAAPPDFNRQIVVPAQAAPGLVTINVCVESACGTGGAQDVDAPLRILPRLADLPADLLRRVLDFYTTTRPFVPEWGAGNPQPLDNIAYPYFRPDITGPAYYEFIVRDETGAPAGSILAATAEHDYPIAYWSSGGKAIAEGLLSAAGGQALNLYKLAPTIYGAETPDLQRLIRAEGQETPMLKVEGLDKLDLDTLQSTFDWTAENGLKQTGLTSTPPGLRVREWASWPELKANYATNDAPILAVWREHAAEEWAMTRRREEVGISLVPGETYTLPLLGGPSYIVAGPVGALIETQETPGALHITAVAADDAGGVPFDIVLRYDDGREERVRFVVLDWRRYDLQLPLVLGGAPAGPPRSQEPARAAVTSETILGWNFVYADGSFGGQRLYNQIPPNTAPNPTSCYSGCGATAWAMLFGFGDNQADVWPINPIWMNKYGLYRQNGGVSTPDVAAPLLNDAGVNNMQMEIRGQIGTFCLFSSGATWPWNMGGAHLYPQRRSPAWVHIFGGFNFVNNEWAHIASSIALQRTPAIMLTGSLNTLHYPLAYGYANARVRDCGWDLFNGYRCAETTRYHYFRINPGWGPHSAVLNDWSQSWVPASTGFHGEGFPCYYVMQGWNLVRVCP